jgi:hypothetical protein
MQGFADIRAATTRERNTLTVFGTWGLEFIKELAELYFVEKRRPRDRARDLRARFTVRRRVRR